MKFWHDYEQWMKRANQVFFHSFSSMFCNFVRRFSYPFGKNINPVRYHLKVFCLNAKIGSISLLLLFQGVNYRSRFLDIFGSKMVYQSPYFALYALERPYNDRPPEWDVPRIHQKGILQFYSIERAYRLFYQLESRSNGTQESYFM